MSDEIRNQINDIIEGEIQLGINDYLEEKQEKEKHQGMGFVTSEAVSYTHLTLPTTPYV